jgi:glycosyltransferase XagB
MIVNALSIVIPAYNEADNILPLVERLHRALTFHDLEYEIIIIDDKSHDDTLMRAYALKKKYPIRIYRKDGEKGKAFSLLQGFTKAKYSVIAMIDADLQYPPENIPNMVRLLIDEKADVVVANRTTREENGVRVIISNLFQKIFSSWLHQIHVDAQSGLKVFKKKILREITLDPKPWTFDLDFLTQARDAGYRIVSYDIAFKERNAGSSKVEVLKASYEIGLEALKLKLRASKVYRQKEHEEDSSFYFNGIKYAHFNHLPMSETALLTLTPKQQKLLFAMISFFLLLFFMDWRSSTIVAIGGMIYFYFTDTLFNLFLVSRSLNEDRELTFPLSKLNALTDDELPPYTIFCPLYKEAHVLPQFIKAIKKLDYPKDKLQVLLLLEQDDKATIRDASKMDLPSYVEVKVVPNTLPKTKPKACNYGLLFATGEFSVIFDAEDVPDPLQLKKAVLAFRESDNHVVCVQAKLNFYNPHQNMLTRLFTAEYSLWFDLILPGLQSLEVPIPLGGTSNHFKTKYLRQLNGWDSFNVTEDCDLGLRLSSKGYKTVIIDSTTFEEGNSQLSNWINQRTRWLKGYMQTYLVHIRQTLHLLKRGKISLLAGIQMVVGGKIIALLVNPIMWLLSILYFSARSTLGPFIESLFPAQIFYFAVAALVIGNFLYLYYFMLAAAKTKRYDLVKYTLFMPVYWLMISLAAWNALVKLIFEPHYWFKTKHGLHLDKKDVDYTSAIIHHYSKPHLAKDEAINPG